MSLLSSEQRKDTFIQTGLCDCNAGYVMKQVCGGSKSYDIVHCKYKIVVPPALRKRLIKWYHILLMHPDINRKTQTIGMQFTWPKLHRNIEKFCKSCKICQITKKTKIKYGKLPPKVA